MNDRPMEESKLAAYLDGSLSDAERSAFEDELVQTPQLAAQVYAEMAARSAVERAQQARAMARRRSVRTPRNWMRWAIPTAAAAVLVLAITTVWQNDDPKNPTVFRGTGGAPVGLEPVGDLSFPPTEFIWSRDPDAARYRFELFDDQSQVVFATTTSDTLLTLENGLQAPAFGYWQITALGPLGVPGRSSQPVSYRVQE